MKHTVRLAPYQRKVGPGLEEGAPPSPAQPSSARHANGRAEEPLVSELWSSAAHPTVQPASTAQASPTQPSRAGPRTSNRQPANGQPAASECEPDTRCLLPAKNT